MTSPDTSQYRTEEPKTAQAARNRRSVALAISLVLFVVLVFILTLVRLKEQALVQP